MCMYVLIANIFLVTRVTNLFFATGAVLGVNQSLLNSISSNNQPPSYIWPRERLFNIILPLVLTQAYGT